MVNLKRLQFAPLGGFFVMEPTPPSKKEIEAWLQKLGKSRTWLAEQMNVSADTVKGWLSAGRPISGAAVPLILQLMEPSPEVNPEFSLSEWEQIQKLAAEEGIPPREWIARVLKKALEIRASDSSKTTALTVNSGAQQPTAQIVHLPSPSILNSNGTTSGEFATGTGPQVRRQGNSGSTKRRK